MQEEKSKKETTLLSVGDLILDMPDAEQYFTYVQPVLKKADVVVGQLEVMYTNRGICCTTDVAAPPCDPQNIKAIKTAGFNVVTLAGNHVFDSGPAGIEDTITLLKGLGISYTGAGMNLAEARTPAIVESNGTKFGFLSYNCVGPRESWATDKKPGCAYVKILTHYELDHATPGGPPSIYTFAEPSSLKAYINDIQQLKSKCDLVFVALHKGIGHVPAKIAMYEQEVSYAAIDAGADAIFGHHAHILKGIEVYKGKVIFHGLGNFVTVTTALNVKGKDATQWALRRKALFGFEPDPEYPTYPFHPEAKQTIIARFKIKDKKIHEVSCIPCWVNPTGQPQILAGDDSRAGQVFEYVKKISSEAGLKANFQWDGEKIIVLE